MNGGHQCTIWLEIIAARRGAYLVSVAQHTGGGQRRGTLADVSSKRASEPALAARRKS
jgi:hypothetical protein